MNSKSSVYNVESKVFDKVINVPSSKSYANRLLILAALDKKDVTLKNVSRSTDVVSMISALKQVGLSISWDDDAVIVRGSFPDCEILQEETITIHSGDGGTTNRFLLALLSRGQNKYELVPAEGMSSRPMGELIKTLETLGAKIETHQSDFWIKVQGPSKTEKKSVEIDSSRSTQFATAVTLAFADTDLDIKPVKLENSKQYFELTNHLVKSFQDQKLDYFVPVDYSSLSYPLAAGAVFGRVHISNCLKIDEFQPDSILIELLKKMGAHIKIDKRGLFVDNSKSLSGLDIDCSGFPDLTPTLAFICAYASGESRLKNLGVLRHKESDRVEEIKKVLKAFSVKFSYDNENEQMTIYGNTSSSCEYKEFYPPADHRIVMISYLFMRANNGGTLHNAHHVNKSFPGFFKLMD